MFLSTSKKLTFIPAVDGKSTIGTLINIFENKIKKKFQGGFEPPSLDSKSRVLTVTPYDHYGWKVILRAESSTAL